MATLDKIPDYFGEYIGGARRDDWRANGLADNDLDTMNLPEIRKYVTRDYVWPLPDAVKAVESGTPAFVVYWQRRIRRLTFSRPHLRSTDDVLEVSKRYVNAIRRLREKVEAVVAEDDIDQFYQDIRKVDLADCVRIYEIKSTMRYLYEMRVQCQNSNFPYAKKATAENRKKAFLPPKLETIEREGEDYRCGVDVTPEIWQEFFNFRGVEFGNWTSQKVRQVSLNCAFDALMDLARCLEIENTDVAFDEKLALAFGSRGRSHSSAHYEIEREVINLTKMHGAGCTAHEWFHALDDRLAKFCGVTDGTLASETRQRDKIPQSFITLIDAMKEDADGNPTDYYRGSKRFDGRFAKAGFGAWASNCEMAARAFACYVKDILGCKSDYLIAHADVYTFEYDNQAICAIPQGEEREILNELFDAVFYDLKDMGFFKERTEKSNRDVLDTPTIGTEVNKVFVRGSSSKTTLNVPADFAFDDADIPANHDANSQVKFYQGEKGQIMFFVSI